MKKTLSIILAVLMAFTGLAPAFAAETEYIKPTARIANTYTVKFEAPSIENGFRHPFVLEEGDEELYRLSAEFLTKYGFEKDGYVDEYFYYKTVNGQIAFEEDPNGKFCYVNNTYMPPENILPDYQDQIPPERYSPVFWEPGKEYTVNAGEVVGCIVGTSEKYNPGTVTMFINGSPATKNSNGEFAAIADRDLTFAVQERDANGEEALLRSHFNVKLASDEGYRVETLKSENYQVTYYGDSFDFRVRILPGYAASGIKVTVQRRTMSLGLGDFLEEEDMEMLEDLIGEKEQLFSYGVDEDGCRLYRIYNITSDCTISVDGVKEESSIGLMAMLKRLLRLICNLLGIEIGLVDSMVTMLNVTVEDRDMPEGVAYEFVTPTESIDDKSVAMVTSGDTVTLVVRKASPDIDVNVSWGPDNVGGTYRTQWLPEYSAITGKITYTAVYNIDNIIADTTVTIK